MSQHADILDQSESLRGPFLGSVALHVVGISSMVALTFLASRGHEAFGTPDAGGGVVGITVVTSPIQLPNRNGDRNPVAHDSESQTPLPPLKAAPKKPAPKDESDAIPLKSRKAPKRLSDLASSNQRFRPKNENPNQLTSTVAPAVSDRLYGGIPGTGAVTPGRGGSLGTRFGAYQQLVQDRVSQHWHTDEIPPQIRTAPIVTIGFEILRDGSVRKVDILQSSGNITLDFSAKRAILEAGQFPPLPPGFERDSAKVEFSFELKR